MLSGLLFADHYDPKGGYSQAMTVISSVLIDGELPEYDDYLLEVAAFCGDECRANFMAYHYNRTLPNGTVIADYFRADLTVSCEIGETISFKMYNPLNDKEYETTTTVTGSENGVGTMPNPLVLNFITPAPQPTTYELPITAWTTNGGYYLIASPVGEVSPGDVTNMIPAEGEGNFDLYYFDQSQELEWINIKDGNTPLQPGKGYLYAREQGATLTFSGTPITESPYVVDLVYDENADLPGWNLIGNPFATQASLDRSYYKLNDEGSEVSATLESEAINAMQGVFVMASEPDPETGEVEPAVFSTSAKTSQNIALNLVRNDRSASLVDRAVVRFDEGGQLPKFMLNPENTKIYIPQGGEDYAVVSSTDNELPVSFKAKENGTYTLKVAVENTEMYYLHLIDHIAGNDVDLLANPSYTFEANSGDFANRFTLVMSNTEGVDEHFAYYNGIGWTISNNGQATLQVIDMTGRVVNNTAIDGVTQLDINAAPGVYMLRLVNGNDVKVQKVVVR